MRGAEEVSGMLTNLELIELRYAPESRILHYVFLADGIEREFTALVSDTGGIRGFNFDPEGNDFLYNFVPDGPRIIKTLVVLTFRRINGEKLDLPQRLI